MSVKNIIDEMIHDLLRNKIINPQIELAKMITNVFTDTIVTEIRDQRIGKAIYFTLYSQSIIKSDRHSNLHIC